MSVQKIDRLFNEQKKVILLTRATLDDLRHRKTRIRELYKCFNKTRTALLMNQPTVENATELWNANEQFKESILEIVECLNEHIHKSQRRIKAAEHTQTQLESLKKRVGDGKERTGHPPCSSSSSSSSVLISNPFRRSVSERIVS